MKSLSLIDGYIKIERSSCVSRQGYPSLYDAKVSCSMDKGCIGILDEKCGDTSNSYYLCSDDMESGRGIDSCVHKKQKSKGRHYMSVMSDYISRIEFNKFVRWLHINFLLYH